ncbi:MAG: hypothetical protein M3Q99_02040 [Acidobacteriota bacterium]|nr:hypothetical protein [Acidobacteriota bacterium]
MSVIVHRRSSSKLQQSRRKGQIGIFRDIERRFRVEIRVPYANADNFCYHHGISTNL